MNTRAALQHAERLCKQRQARLTPQRRRVLQLVIEADKPIGAYELLEQMRDGERRPAPPTVYRALDFLLEQGLIHRIESLHAFIGCAHAGTRHTSQFLVCTDCGQVEEVCTADLGKTLQQEVQRSGFLPSRPVIELLGLCQDCNKRTY